MHWYIQSLLNQACYIALALQHNSQRHPYVTVDLGNATWTVLVSGLCSSRCWSVHAAQPVLTFDVDEDVSICASVPDI